MPKHLGWAVFDRTGGAAIIEVAMTGIAKSVGTTLGTPHIRLRHAANFPKKVATVRKEHKLLFDEYKKIKRQVRTLIAMGVPFLFRSSGSCVLVDRHPDFGSGLIDKELARRKKEAVGEFARSLRTIMEAIIATKKRTRKASPLAEDPDAELVGPYARQRQLAEKLKNVYPNDLYNGIMKFLDGRGIEGQIAEGTKKTENDLDRYEVE
jgi:hypothetical protein